MEHEVEVTVKAVCPQCQHAFEVTETQYIEIEPDDEFGDPD